MIKSKYAIIALAVLLFFALGTFYIISKDGQQEEAWEPDFIVVGAQKAGTTVLTRLIKQHPAVQSAKNEVHFFDINFSKGIDWYKSHFKKRTSRRYIIGEKSPYYFFHPDVPKRIVSLFPKVKLIAVLRNPIDRAYSQYWHNKRKNKHKIIEELSFEDAIAAESKRLENERIRLLSDITYVSNNHRLFSYASRGMYAEQLKNWLSFFPREQILIISSSDLRNNPYEVMERVYAFLDLKPFKNFKLEKDKHSHYPAINEKTRAMLLEYFRPHNEELEALLGENFNWH